MPVERLLTPRPQDDPSVLERVEKAKAFIECVVKFFSDTNQMYKFFLFGWITLMMLFVFVVDSETYDFREMGNEVYGGVAVVEVSLAAACVLAILGLINTRTIYVLPLLFLQMSIFFYGFFYYLRPYAAIQQNSAILQLDRMVEFDSFSQLLTVSKSLFMILLRTCPLFVQFLFTALTAKVVICIAIIERHSKAISTVPELPHFQSRTNSLQITCNSHIWSAIHRKVLSRRREENLEPIQRLPRREFFFEMSAKFRRSAFPKPLLQADLPV